ncbi:hypothetical protein AKJ16_DCAP24972 [Drosera capensis]
MAAFLHLLSSTVHLHLSSSQRIIHPNSHSPIFSSTQHLISCHGKSKLISSSPIHCNSSKNESNHHHSFLEGFSALEPDIPWEDDNLWSTMALYLFSIHVPLSFGGLSVVAQVLHRHDLEPGTKVRKNQRLSAARNYDFIYGKVQAISVLVIQTLELFAAILLLRFTAKPHYKLTSFFKAKNFTNKRNWLFGAILGFIFLISVVFLTSYLADLLTGKKAVNSPALKEILVGGNASRTACVLVYCIVTPLLEEIMYRGFLLTSLASKVKWRGAMLISSAIFSAAHLSGENFVQLFTVGVILGCCYCWTGDLRSSVVLHSVYNGFILFVTYLS